MRAALDEMWTILDRGGTETDLGRIAIAHQVGESTLYRYKRDEVRIAKKRGRFTALPEPYEELLAQRIKSSPLGSRGWDAEMIKTGGQMIFSMFSESNGTKFSPPQFSDQWLASFCDRHGIGRQCPVELSAESQKSNR